MLRRGEGFEGLRRVDEILEVAGEDARFLHGLEHLERLGGRAPERLRAQDGLARFGCKPDGFSVHIVGEPDDDDLGFRVPDGLAQISAPAWDPRSAANALALSAERE